MSMSRVREGPAISVQVVVGVVLLVVLAAHVFILVVLGILGLIDASGAAAITAMVVGMFLLHLLDLDLAEAQAWLGEEYLDLSGGRRALYVVAGRLI